MSAVEVKRWSYANRKYLFAGCCLLLMALFAAHSLAVGYSSDDGFIAFQYVKNLVQGNGLVYNVGERVEGYNNFLWLILLAGIARVFPSIKLLYISDALGIAFGCVTILLVCRFSRTVRNEDGPFVYLAGALLAVHSGMAAWATGGLETTLYAMLVFASAYAYLRFLRTGKDSVAVPVLFVLATLTRPDALLLFGVTLAHFTLFQLRTDRKLWLRTVLIWLIVFAALFAPYYLWRFAYYGYPLPNTFYAKLGGGNLKYFRGLAYITEYLKIYGVFVFIPALMLLFRRKRTVWIDYFALLIAAYFCYLIYVGGDGLAFFRFVVYISPLIYVLVQEGFANLYYGAKRLHTLNAVSRTAIALSIIAAFTFTMRQTVFPILFQSREQWYDPQSQLYFPGGNSHSYLWFDNYFVDRLAIAAEWIENNARPGALVAATPAGSIAYNMKNHKVIDMLGLNDEHIAHTKNDRIGAGRAGHEKGDGKYVLQRSPDYILMGNVAVFPFPLDEKTMREKLRLKSEHELWADPEFHQKYELRCVRLADQGLFQYFSFFQKKELGQPTQAINSRENTGNSR